MSRERLTHATTPSDHGHWPATPRGRYPKHWLVWYGLHRFAFFSPKIGLRSLMVTVTPLPFRWGHGVMVGAWAGRNEDDTQFEIRLSIGLVEVDIDVMEWLR